MGIKMYTLWNWMFSFCLSGMISVWTLSKRGCFHSGYIRQEHKESSKISLIDCAKDQDKQILKRIKIGVLRFTQHAGNRKCCVITSQGKKPFHIRRENTSWWIECMKVRELQSCDGTTSYLITSLTNWYCRYCSHIQGMGKTNAVRLQYLTI